MATRYWKLLDDSRVYAVLRLEDNKLPERWSPTRKAWKDAPFHYQAIMSGEDHPVEIDSTEVVKLTAGKLPDISDADWAALSASRDE